VSHEIQVEKRFIVVRCDFASLTLGYRWRSNPRSSLRFNIPWSTHQPLSSPIPVDLGRGSSHHVVVFYTSCFAHQDKYYFVLFGKVATPPTLSIRQSGYENAYKVCTLCFGFSCEDTKQLVFQLHQKRTQVCTVSFFVLFLFFRHTTNTPSTSGTHTGGVQ